MERPAPRTPRPCVCREDVSRQAAMASWTLTRSLTSAECAEETTTAARKSQDCSPNLRKYHGESCSVQPQYILHRGHCGVTGLTA